MRDSYCVECGKSFCVEVEEVKHSECEEVLVEDSEVEQEVRRVVEERYLQESISEDNAAQLSVRLSELMQFNTPCGIHCAQDEDSSCEDRTDQDCTFGPASNHQILLAFCKTHNECITSRVIEDRCQPCVHAGMVFYSKIELEKIFQEKIHQIIDNFKQVDKHLIKAKLSDYVLRTSEEVQSIYDSSNFIAEKEGELLPINSSFINPQQWVEPVLKMHQSLKENAGDLEVNTQSLENTFIPEIINRSCEKFQQQIILLKLTESISEIDKNSDDFHQESSEKSSSEEEETHKSNSNKDDTEESKDSPKKGESFQDQENDVVELQNFEQSLEAQKKLDNKEQMRRDSCKSEEDCLRDEIEQDEPKSLEKQISSDESESQQEEFLKNDGPSNLDSCVKDQKLMKVKQDDFEEIKKQRVTTPPEKQEKKLISKIGCESSFKQSNKFNSSSHTESVNKSSSLMTCFKEDSKLNSFLQPLACTMLAFLRVTNEKKVHLYLKSLSDYESKFSIKDLTAALPGYFQGDYVCINDCIYLFGYLKHDRSFNRNIYKIDFSIPEISVEKVQEASKNLCSKLIHKSIIGMHYKGSNLILISGGFDPGSNHMNDKNYCFNPETNELFPCAKLNQSRAHHSLCQLREEIYAIGGIENFEGKTKHVDQVEIISIDHLLDKNQLFNLCTKEHHFSDIAINSGCVSLGDKILVFGGQKSSSKYVKRNGFIYNISGNYWDNTKIITQDMGRKVQLEHSVKFLHSFVVKEKQRVGEEKEQSGYEGMFDMLKTLQSSIEEDVRKQKGSSNLFLQSDEKLFFVGETNQGFPIIYTLTVNKARVNMPQKFEILMENEIIRKGFE
ncbi:unnamed protein product [Moneuplotes crassus]|uniref:Kelch motif family protein n=1 Tax=Euplotes crassus TaxID=5936 RepID=A0AAD2D435_EUPCR|nr:unnamed protein product [Moneuplotes crassus]